MTTILNLRATEDDIAVLNEVRRPGETVTDVLRRGLRAASVLQQRELMRAEAERLDVDLEDRAEVAAVRADMDSLRAW